MRAFVTGGTGFVGSHLVEELLRRGTDVRALVRSTPKWLDGLPVEVLPGGLDDTVALEKALRDVDAVFHVGGLTRAPAEADLFEANVEATRRLLDAAAGAGVPRVLVTSSQAAAGPSAGAPLDESAPMRPLSAYGRSKAAMEEMVRAHDIADRTVIVRPPSVYGPREADIHTIIRTADRQRIFPVVGDPGAPALALVHIDDLVRGMADAAESDAAAGGTFFLTGERDYAWDELHRALERALGHRVLRVPVPGALVVPAGALAEGAGRLFGRYPPINREKARELRAEWRASSARAADTFGFEPTVGLDAGMRDTVQWYRKHGWL
jgi:nucleoside-diphosphate-sugar epimerase